MVAAVEESQGLVARFCRERGLSWLASVSDDRGRSPNGRDEVYLLFEFAPGRDVSMIDVMGYEMDLETLLGQRVTMRRPVALEPARLDQILSRAETIYGSR